MIWVGEKSDTLNSQVIIFWQDFLEEFPIKWDAYGWISYSVLVYNVLLPTTSKAVSSKHSARPPKGNPKIFWAQFSCLETI